VLAATPPGRNDTASCGEECEQDDDRRTHRGTVTARGVMLLRRLEGGEAHTCRGPAQQCLALTFSAIEFIATKRKARTSFALRLDPDEEARVRSARRRGAREPRRSALRPDCWHPFRAGDISRRCRDSS
jgi:hypothetical protein